MLEELLKGDMGDIVSDLSSKLGTSEDQAGGFIQKAIAMIENLLGKGDLDLSALMQGDLSAITSKLDLGSLGSMLGGGEAEGQKGVEALMGSLGDKLGGDDAAGMLEKLTGGADLGDMLGGLGGMFGKG